MSELETFVLSMEDVARDLELDFRSRDSVFSGIEHPPFNGPTRGLIRNVMHGTWRGEKLWVFEFPIATDSDGDFKPKDLRSAICFSNEAIQWPKTSISPYRTVDRLAGLFFTAESDNSSNESGPRFVVDCDDKQWPGLADRRLKTFLNDHPHLEISIRPGVLSIYRTPYRVEPYEVEEYLEHAHQLLTLVLDAQAPADATLDCDFASFSNQETFLVPSQRSKVNRLTGTVVALFVLMICGGHLWQAWRQWNAASFAETDCWMKVVEFDEGVLSAMQFQYEVNGRVYTGGARDRRIVWRPIRIGDHKAQRLEPHWRHGKRAPLFYDPDAPEVGILDNSFTKGDANLVKLVLSICAACAVYIVWPLIRILGKYVYAAQLRKFKPVEGPSQVRYPLPLAPYTLDTLVFSSVPLALLLFARFFTLIVEPNAWLDGANFWLQVLIGLNVAVVPLVYAWERWWRGHSGDQLVATLQSRQLLIPRPGRGALEVNFDQVTSIRLRETSITNNTMSVLDGYDPVMTYVDEGGHRKEVMVTRFFSRELGRRCVSWLRSTTGLTPSDASTASRSDQGRNVGPSDKSRRGYRSLISRLSPEQLGHTLLTIGVVGLVLSVFGIEWIFAVFFVSVAIIIAIDLILVAGNTTE